MNRRSFMMRLAGVLTLAHLRPSPLTGDLIPLEHMMVSGWVNPSFDIEDGDFIRGIKRTGEVTFQVHFKPNGEEEWS